MHSTSKPFITYVLGLVLLIASTSTYAQKGLVSESFDSGNRKASIHYFVQYKSPNQEKGTLLYQGGAADKNKRQQINFKGGKTGFFEVIFMYTCNKKNRDIFFIKETCLEGNGQLQRSVSRSSSFPITYTEKFDHCKKDLITSNKNTISFTAQENGAGTLVIHFGIYNKNKGRLDTAQCNAGQITIKYDIKGLEKEKIEEEEVIGPLPPDQETMAWEGINKNSLDALCQFLRAFPIGKYTSEARAKLQAIDKQLWQQYNTQKITDLENYRSQTANCENHVQYRQKAFTKIKALQRQQDLQRIEKEWKEFIASKPDEAATVAFIGKTKWNRQRAFDRLKDRHQKLEFIKQEDQGVYTVKILNPYFKPRYKNISLKPGLVIRASNWKEGHELQIDVEENGQFKVLVEDSLGRQLVIPLGNTFEANLIESDTTYVVNILGGKAPYSIVLQNNGSAHQEEFETAQDQYVFNKTDLIKKNFIGEYAIKVSYQDGPQAIELDQAIFLEKPPSYLWVWISILALIILSAGIYLFRWLSKRRKKYQTIFDA